MKRKKSAAMKGKRGKTAPRRKRAPAEKLRARPMEEEPKTAAELP